MPYYSIGMATTFSNLRKAYWNRSYNIVPGDDDHHKIVATHFDYILSTIERTFFYRSFMDFFSKFRVFSFMGISAGFTFTTDHLIAASINNQLVSYQRANELYENLSKDPNFNKI